MATTESKAVDNFREYLQILSVHPEPDYDGCVTFLEKQASALELPIKVHHFFAGKPVVVVSWEGNEPNLPTILLNGHMDVVPVFEDDWSYPPFGAEMDEEGNIYARGTQDMKSVGIQYLEAIRKLKEEGVTLRRTVHVSFVPDEEIGGVQGMEAFSKSKEFEKLNVGFALDEGSPSEMANFLMVYGERTTWNLRIRLPGQSGHGSQMLDNTAAEKVRHLMDKFYDFRAQENAKLTSDPSLTLGDVTTINVTQLLGGVQVNVIPPEFEMLVDCRIAATVDLEDFEATINQWCTEAGDGISIEYLQKQPQGAITILDDSNLYWVAFKKAAHELNMDLSPVIFPAATDARFVRRLGLPAIGFSPISCTKIRAHAEDEYLNVNIFLRDLLIRLPGQSGHGSQMLDNTAAQKVHHLMDKFYDFRAQENAKLNSDPSLTLGGVTTINVTQLLGGVQVNVIPPEFEMLVDCRIAATVDLEDFEATINQWCTEAGDGISIEYLQKQPQGSITILDDSNLYWVAFKKAADEL